MFDTLTERLTQSLRNVTGSGQLTEDNIKDTLREVRMALLEADVALPVTREFIAKVKEEALGQEVMTQLSPGQAFVKIVHDELTKMMGAANESLDLAAKPPVVVLLAGLQGAGKTTTAAKLARFLQERQKKKVAMVSADVYRPAAIKQLQTVAGEVGAIFLESHADERPIDIAKRAIEQAKIQFADVLIVDTAGRLHIDENLMEELKQIKDLAQPNEILLVVDAMTGQDAVNVAESFNQQLGITGVVITKLDGDTRGGAALSIRQVTGAPIKFTGTGEKLTDLEVFHPDRMSSRILGMGDMLTLIEKAQQDYDEKKAEELAQKMKENSFDFNDFVEQIDQVMGMGPIEDLLKMIPGMSQMPGIENVKVDPKQIARQKAMVYSMTPAERENPDLLNPSRRRRIAAGSGNSVVEVNRMIKQFKESRKMMQQMSKGNMNIPGMDQMFGGGVKGKLGKMAMNRMVKKQKKKKKKRK